MRGSTDGAGVKLGWGIGKPHPSFPFCVRWHTLVGHYPCKTMRSSHNGSTLQGRGVNQSALRSEYVHATGKYCQEKAGDQPGQGIRRRSGAGVYRDLPVRAATRPGCGRYAHVRHLPGGDSAVGDGGGAARGHGGPCHFPGGPVHFGPRSAERGRGCPGLHEVLWCPG